MSDENSIQTGKGPGKKKRIALIIICVILALFLLLLVAGSIYVEHTLNKIPRATTPNITLSQEEIDQIQNGTDEGLDDFTGESLNPEDATLSTVPPEEIQADHIINILLIGQDRRPGEGRARSDAMILCTFNTEKKTLTMTSFLRDLYVKIPGYQDNRINAAYALGGMELLNATLEKNFGVHVDGNVEVDFSEFEKIINLLGGVDISLTAKEADHMSSNEKTYSAGMNHLNGKEALRYSRIRYIDSDFGRTNRQRTVLNALLQAYKNKPLNEMISLLDEILPIVTTDLKNSEIIDVAMEVFPMLAGCSVKTQHIPAEGTYQSVSIRGMAVLYPDLEANQKLLVETLLAP